MRLVESLLSVAADFPEVFGAAAFVVVLAAVLAAARDRIVQRPPAARPTEDAVATREKAECIESPTRRYEFIERFACGDLCDVYSAASDRRHYALKVPRITSRNQLLEKEVDVLKRLIAASGPDLYREYFPQPLESFCADGRRINSFEWRDGSFTAEEILTRHPAGIDGRHLAWMFNRILEALGFIHRQGWIHGAVLPPHLMFHAENHGLQLVGWIHAVRIGEPLRIASERFKAWYPPECHERKPATPSLDLYLAARSMVYLAGGDPLRDAVPEGVPLPIRRFLTSCLLESSRMRPHDAWSLYAGFTEVLERVYGSPAYHHLDMS